MNTKPMPLPKMSLDNDKVIFALIEALHYWQSGDQDAARACVGRAQREMEPPFVIPVGTIWGYDMWHGQPKDGWLECDGRPVDLVRYPELARLMTAVPDLRANGGKGVTFVIYAGKPAAPGYTINGKPYEDHSPVAHNPKHWMPLPPPPQPDAAEVG